MDFRLLGPLEVTDGDRAIALGGAKQRALLAVLLLHANEVVPTERLIDELWGAAPPATVAKSVQVYVSRLRRGIGQDRLVTRAPGYLLRVEPSELDVARFERLVAQADAADDRAAAPMLREALGLWRGPPLADLAYEAFAQPEIARLDELRLAALERRFDAELAVGAHAALAGELEALARQHPLRERLQAQLMLCLYRCGRQGDALDAFRSTRRALVEELGIEPGRPLRDLQEAILRQDPALDRAPSPARPPDASHGAFVGRGRELGDLLAGLDDAFDGHGRLYVIAGEPGIGKSRLAEELIAHATARGARVLVGRCWEAGGAPAYWPWVESLRACVRSEDDGALRGRLGSGAADLAQIVPELRERFPDLDEGSALEPEAARFRLFDGIAEYVRAVAEQMPVVLVLDDLHAADASSLLLLQFVARRLAGMRVLVLAACRDVDPLPSEPLARTLAEVAREPVTRRMTLGGLSEGELGEYLQRAAAAIASPALAAALHADTDGNPLFATEMVRLMAVEGSGDGRVAMPQSVRDVVTRRVAHLSSACREALLLASVFGREFEPGTLAVVAGTPEDELLETLDEALEARVIADAPGGAGRLRFAHVLIRDALYEGVSSGRRAALHRRAVDALEARCGADPGPRLAELAHHAVAGRDGGRALAYARRAGDRARGLLAYEEAGRLYRSALTTLETLGGDDERTRCELLLAVADADSRAGDTAASRRALLEAAAIARRLGLSRELAHAAAEYSGRIVYVRAGSDEQLMPLLEEALAALPAEEIGLRAGLLARLAGALRDEPSRARRDALSSEAVELARRSRDPAALADALDGRALAVLAPDTVAEVLAIGTELLELAERAGDPEQIVHGHMHRLGALLMMGDAERAREGVEAASRVAARLRQPAHMWDVEAARAMLAVATGPVGEAEVLVEEALELGGEVEPAMVVPVACLQRHTLGDFRGSVAEVEPALRELVATHPARRMFRCALIQTHARLGRRQEARQELADLAAGGFEALPFDPEWLFGISLLAEASVVLEEAAAARTLYDLLLPWAALNVVDPCEGIRGSAARYLGLLAAATGRPDAAELHFEAALAMNARSGFRPWLALTQRDYAQMLARRGGAGDRERAAELGEAARVAFRELGMTGYAAGGAPVAGR
jgi:eukaryotic-like serine/threonine-protein kinase